MTDEQRITQLTKNFSRKCHGESAVVVIGVGLNLVGGSLANVPPGMQRELAAFLRKWADETERGNFTMTSGPKH